MPILGFYVTASTLPTSPVALVRHPPLLLYIASRALSEFSYQVATVAVGWQIYALTGSAFYLGLAGLVQFSPSALLVASNQLGEFESGMAAALLGAMPAAALGGLGTIAIALLWMKLFPVLREVDQLE